MDGHGKNMIVQRTLLAQINCQKLCSSLKMTEDDTFNRLRRTPVQDMRILLKEWSLTSDDMSDASMTTLLQKHGWTQDEYYTTRVVMIMNKIK